MALPSGLTYCRIDFCLLDVVDDSRRAPNRHPNGVSFQGARIEITADAPHLLAIGGSKDATLPMRSRRFTTDTEGMLMQADGQVGTEVIASDSPNVSPHLFTYTARVSHPLITPFEVTFLAPSGGVIDLTSVVPVPPEPGEDLVEWARVSGAVQADAAQAKAAALDAATSATTASQKATAAAGSATAADGAAQSAKGYRDQAQTQTSAAAGSATAAASSATTASQKATAASTSATNAASSASGASSSATAAQTARTQAQTAATNASSSATAAAASATAASASADRAEAAVGTDPNVRRINGVDYQMSGSLPIQFLAAEIEMTTAGAYRGAKVVDTGQTPPSGWGYVFKVVESSTWFWIEGASGAGTKTPRIRIGSQYSASTTITGRIAWKLQKI